MDPDAYVDALNISAVVTGGSSYSLVRVTGYYNDEKTLYYITNSGNQTIEGNANSLISSSGDWFGKYNTHYIEGHSFHIGRIRWKLPASEYGKTVRIDFGGTWQRNSASDVSLSANASVVATGIKSPANASAIFSQSGNNCQVDFSWNYTSGDLDPANYKIEEGSAQITSGTYTASGNAYSLSLSDESYLNSKHTYKISTYVSNTYHLKELDVIVPAYPQASDFTVDFDHSTRKVKLSWKSQTQTGTPVTDYLSGDVFRIQRSTSSDFSTGLVTLPDVAYVAGTGSYTFEDTSFVKNDANQVYYYRICRTYISNWLWKCFTKTAKVNINTGHLEIASVLPVVFDTVNFTATIKWTLSNSVWFNNSSFTIKRVNLTNNSEVIIFESKDSVDVNKCEYVDDMLSFCNRYLYKLDINANNTLYKHKVVFTNNFMLVKVGKLVTFEADKGYNLEKVVLKWSYDGDFSQFYIQRKVYGAADSDYQPVSYITVLSSQKDYSYEDMSCYPGVIYLYNIIGIKECADTLYTSNPLTDVGFRRPVGIASGHVHYGSGTAVPGVRVTAITLNPNDNVNAYKSVLFSGNANSYMKIPNAAKVFNQRDSFAFQAYIFPHAKNGDILNIADNKIRIYYNNNNITFTVGTTTITAADTLPLNSFRHLTATYQRNAGMQLYLNNFLVASNSVVTVPASYTGQDSIIIGKNFKGNVDEVRLWGKHIDSAANADNYSCFMTGNEEGMAAYYRFEEAIPTVVYDMSVSGMDNYHKNHAALIGGNETTLSDIAPGSDRLAPAGITDVNGDYVITAIPYSGTGTTYRFVPNLGIHSFSPTNKLRMISPSTLVQGDVDFEDVSSFKVWGKIYYAGTSVPVSGVTFIVDGQNPCMKNGKLIETDVNGEYEIEVPIGFHFITAQKTGHTLTALRGSNPALYVANNRFPADTTQTYDFQSIEELNFEDNTLVELVGRFVGGPIEGKKPVGFGLSKNNLGVATIQLKLSDKLGILNIVDENNPITKYDTSSSGKISSVNRIMQNTGGNYFEIKTDPQTGEFVAWLLPEKYQVNNTNYEIRATTNTTNRLTYSDVIDMKVMQEDIILYDIDTAKTVIADTLKKAVDTIQVNQKMDIVLRLSPTMEVLDASNPDGLFGDRIYVANDAVTGIADTIDLIQSNAYLLGFPIFTHQEKYKFDISVFEEYLNYDGGATPVSDRVPTVDGTVIAENNMATIDYPDKIKLDSLGRATYIALIAAPNITYNQINPSQSYNKNFNFRVVFEDGTPEKIWNITDRNAYVLGAKSDGNNFVTRGPHVIDFVLHDPPGSNSYAWMEKGTTITKTEKWGGGNKTSLTIDLGIKAGVSVETFVGTVVAGTIQKLALIDENHVAGSTTHGGGKDNTFTKTITTNRKIETSSDPEYVGPDADVFIGSSYNLIFGEAKMISLLDANNVTDPIPVPIVSRRGKNYRLGSERGMFMVPQFKTSFAFTRRQIVTSSIPNLEKLRNDYLIYYPVGTAPTVNNSSLPVYISILPDNNPNYGKSNTDEVAFGNAAKVYSTDYNNNAQLIKNSARALSYYILYPKAWLDINSDTLSVDSVALFNGDISAWEQVLANDEKYQLDAAKKKNISFDAGVVWEETTAYDTTSITRNYYEGSLKATGTLVYGGSWNETGIIVTNTLETEGTWFSEDEETDVKSNIYGYHLADENADDYHTVDIKTSSQTYSTPFKLLGGQTSCPYEDEIKTVYYEPDKGHVLQQATAKVQDPYMAISPQTQLGIPGNRTAHYTLMLGNQSLVSQVWYTLTVDEKTNPNGLIISIDGQPIGNGRVFSFDPTESFNKTLSVKRSVQDVTDYDSIRLLLTSDCQEDLFYEVYFSVHFLPACTDLVLDRPVNKQILNRITGDSVMFEVIDYDVNYLNFNEIVLEYRSNTVNTFTPFFHYYKDMASYDAATGISPAEKAVIDTDIPGQSGIARMWHAPAMDGVYLLQARSVCPAGAADKVESLSEEIEIVKDMISPLVFGTPQPANGILSIGDDIMVTFNENIQPDNTYRITVQGELNGDELLHNYGLYFDGINDAVEIKQPTNLEGKSFTVEMWTKQEGTPQNSVLFSHGDADNKFELGLNANNQLWVSVNNSTVTAQAAVNDIGQSWTHLSAVYNNQGATPNVTVYVNGISDATKGGIPSTNVGSYTTTGIINMATNTDKTLFYNGRINEVRLWTKALDGTSITINMNSKLSGVEAGLFGYWEMDEGYGTFVSDRIRSKNGITNAEWFVLPGGKSLEFDGTIQYAKANIQPEMSNESDFSIEFWFKADSSNTNAGLFSTGIGDEQDVNTGNTNNHFSLYFDQNKDLTLRSASKIENIASGLADNNWHHFALSVNSRGNANIYVDANLQKAIYSSDYFQGFNGTKLWLGAVGWEKDILTDTTAMYFKGNIDELRIWQAALTQEGVKLSATSHLQGNEIGLRAYYPFDSIETNTIVNTTLCDQLDTSRIENGNEVRRNQPMTLNNGADFSNVAASIKPNKRVQNVQFDRVYKDDQIAVSLLSQMSSIENCILDISVADIKDMHGNIIESAVKWTAFIDKNYLKWSEEHLEFVKDVFEPLSFSLTVINRSGLSQMYSIENMPAWLTVNHPSGTIPPAGSVEVTFTVNEGLNIGTYDENIYLRNSSGFNELLALDLRVIGEQPQWEVNPSLFDYSMNIFGELNIKGIVSTDAEDMLAAFNSVTGECAGVTKLRYIAEYDRYLAFLNVYGNTSGTPLTFKIWDASTGIIYTDVLPDTLTFMENSYKGTAKNPITFRALNIVEQIIDVYAGWNWISTNVRNRSGNMSPQSVFEGNTFAQNDHLKGQQPSIFTSYTNGIFPPFNGNTSVDNALGYMLKVATGKRLVIIGEPVKPDTVNITVTQGWTWIGYTPQINLSLNEAFVGLNPADGDLVKSQNAFSVYYEGTGGWLGTLNYLTPGNAYLYNSQQITAQTFFYPNVSVLANSRKYLKSNNYLVEKDAELGVDRSKYQNNLTIIARLDADEVAEDGGNIISYVQSECRGYGEAVYVNQIEDNLYFITVSGDREDQKLNFRYRTIDGKTYTLNESLNFSSHKSYGTITNSVVFTIGEMQTEQDRALMAYPVPFSNSLTVSYLIDENETGDVYFSIIDMTGKVLATLSETQFQSGWYTLLLDAHTNNLAQGVYFVKMQTSNKVQTVKVIKTNR
jgi:hypothetical protein